MRLAAACTSTRLWKVLRIYPIRNWAQWATPTTFQQSASYRQVSYSFLVVFWDFNSSRWRPDQRLLETGELDRAEDEKKRIESIQRQAAAKRNEAGLKYEPRFFVQDGETYTTRKNYWEERDKREYWTNVVPLW